MLSLFIRGKTLIDRVSIDGEVPGEIAEGVISSLERPALEHARVSVGISSSAVILSRVNGDEARVHPACLPASRVAFRNESFRDFRRGLEGTSAPGGAA